MWCEGMVADSVFLAGFPVFLVSIIGRSTGCLNPKKADLEAL